MKDMFGLFGKAGWSFRYREQHHMSNLKTFED